MGKEIVRLTACVLFAVVATGAVDPDLPSPAPRVNGVFPHGAPRGAITSIELTGLNLHDAETVQFAGAGVHAKIIAATSTKLSLQVTIAPDAEPGRRDFRLITGRGAYIGVFDVGTLPEIREIENNDDWRKPQALSLPVLVNGIIGSEDWDHFSFHAEAGTTIVFDVAATQHGSRLDADLALLDRDGQELAWVDDTGIFGDPHLEYTFPTAGIYVIRVGSLAGGPNADYRLSVGVLPYVQRTVPAGMARDVPTEVTLTGTHLDLIDSVTIGSLPGLIVRKSPREAVVRFTAPRGVLAGNYKLHAAYQGREVALPIRLQISTLPELTVPRDATSAKWPRDVQPGTVLNGVIGQPRESHRFRFHANAGESFLFRAESMKLGYHLDPALTLFDAAGNKLANADDPGIDDRSDEYQVDADLSYQFANGGDYTVSIRDAMYRGGDRLVYRLSIERKTPDFLLELREPVKTLYRGQDASIQVRVRWRGWTTPVEVWAENLPPGAAGERATAQPRNSVVKDTCGVDRELDGTIVLIPLHPREAQAGGSEFRIVGRGVLNGKTVEHTAVVRYENAAAGFIYGPMEVQTALLTVVEPHPVILSVPDTIAAAARLKVSIRRFSGAKTGTLRLRFRGQRAGSMEETFPEGTKEAELAIPEGAGALVVEAINDEGTIVGISPPVQVQSKKPILEESVRR